MSLGPFTISRYEKSDKYSPMNTSQARARAFTNTMKTKTRSTPETGDLKLLASQRRASDDNKLSVEKDREDMVSDQELEKQIPRTKRSSSKLFARAAQTAPETAENYLYAYQRTRERYERAYNVSVWAMGKRHESERKALVRELDRKRAKRGAELRSRRDYCPWRWNSPEDQIEQACIHHSCFSKRVAHIQFTSSSCTYCLWHHLLRAHSRELWKLYDEHHDKARAAYRKCRKHVNDKLVRWEAPLMKTELARGSKLQVTDWAENAMGKAGQTRKECAEQIHLWEVQVQRCCINLFTLRESFVGSEELC